MPAYFLFDVKEITDPAAMDRYRAAVFATVSKHGGRYLLIGGDVTPVEGGELRPTFPVLIEFPSPRQARGWYDDPEYRALKDLRLSATRGDAVLLEPA